MKKLKGIIDRFEGDYVVIEISGENKNYLKSNLPDESLPGDVVYIQGDTITLNKDETEKRRKEIEDLMNEVWDD